MENETIQAVQEGAETVSHHGGVGHIFFGSNRKKAVVLAGGVIGLAVLGFCITRFARVSPQEVKTSTVPQATSSIAIKKTTYGNILPPGYPTQIPVEKESKLMSSYTKEYPTKMYQMSTLYSSQKDVTKNALFYKKFMDQDGWKITSSSTRKDVTLLQGVKGAETLEVIVRKKPEMGKNAMASTTQDASVLSYIIINIFRK